MSTIIMKVWMFLIACVSSGGGIKVGKAFHSKGLFFIMKNRNGTIHIGDCFRVNSSPLSSLIGLYQRSIIVARRNGRITIGNNVGITGATIRGSDISIGDNVMVGANTKIIDHDFHSLDYVERRTNAMDHEVSRPVSIGDDVFIGCNCIVLKGTRIGNRCIIGAGSVVSGCFDDDCLIAGNPAKMIKRINVATRE